MVKLLTLHYFSDYGLKPVSARKFIHEATETTRMNLDCLDIGNEEI